MINKLNLTGFGKHKNFSAIFKPGVNAIIGENRKGKTQILEAICFAFFGKTKNSTLDKIINFDSEKAEVNLYTDKFEFSRNRTQKASSLGGIKKLELDQYLNLEYTEFLNIFYLSAHEQVGLFDAAYCRNFLIKLFDLNKYSEIYKRLYTEYNVLNNVVEKEVKFNKKIIKDRITRLEKIRKQYQEESLPYRQAVSKGRTKINEFFSKAGEFRSKLSVIDNKARLLKQDKCTECSRPIELSYKQALAKKLKDAKNKIMVAQNNIDSEKRVIQEKIQKVESKIAYFEKKISRVDSLLHTLKYKYTQQPVRKNKQRIKELEKVLPIFSGKGFPTFLLQTYIPVITETANSLLSLIFPDTKISIRTEKPESNRPDFKIIISRGEEELFLKDLSGSECVLVNLCLRFGILVIYKQLSNTGIDFLLCDEGLEKLDDVNSIKVLKLFDNIIKMGYLDQVILVTHKNVLKTQDTINYLEL